MSNMYTDHFSIKNIPFGIASSSSHPEKSVVTRFEDSVLFLDELVNLEPLKSLSEETKRTFSQVSKMLTINHPQPVSSKRQYIFY